MPERNPGRNAGYIKYIQNHTLDAWGNQIPQSRIAEIIGVGGALISQIKSGDKRVSAGLMLKTLQALPPKDWAEFAVVGKIWDMSKSKRHAPAEPVEKNSFLFYYLALKTNARTDAELGEMLGYSRAYISGIRSGKHSVSDRFIQRVDQRFPSNDEEVMRIRKAWKESKQNDRFLH